MLAQFVP